MIHSGSRAWGGMMGARYIKDVKRARQSYAARVQQNDAKFNEQMSRLFSSKPKLFWIAIGKEDFLIQQNNGLRQYLDAHNYPYEYYENDGGHIWRNWRIYLSMFAQKIFRD